VNLLAVLVNVHMILLLVHDMWKDQ
jgi:hypothetical protein